MERFIVVTGLPASGKSTVARAVAAALGLPRLDKDVILEELFDSLGIGDAEWRRRLSRAADEILRGVLRAQGAVLDSWWRHPRSPIDSGTPSDWLGSLPGSLVELHCMCEPQVAAERFLSRKRHEGHLDGSKSRAELLTSFQQLASLGPLGIGRLVEVDTQQPLSLSALVRELS